MQTLKFDPQALSSRKLWQLVNTGIDTEFDDEDLHEAVAELARRRHYLEHLQEIGALDATTKA